MGRHQNPRYVAYSEISLLLVCHSEDSYEPTTTECRTGFQRCSKDTDYINVGNMRCPSLAV